MTYQIHQPAIPNADDKWTAAEHLGNLLLFFPTEVRRGIKTSNGDSDAVSCSRVVNLDTGRILHNTLIFGTALVPNIGGGAPDGVVLGRLGQGEGKPGQSKPWILLPHDENELRVCQDWLARDAQGQITQPTGPPTPAAQGGWGQQAQAPAYGSTAPATGGWGQQAAPAPQQGGWGAPAPAAPSPAPQAGGWGNPPQQAGGWQGAAAAPAPAPAAPAPAPTATSDPGVHPGLVEALRKKGVTLQPGQSQQDAESIWGYVANNPDVA